MKLLYRAMGALVRRGPINVFLAALLALVPASALAAGSEANVALNFTQNDMVLLYVSLGLGALALIVAWMLTRGVLRISPGSEKMQEVGLAIREGALAYLLRQVKTMSIFVVLIAVGLFFLYQDQYDSTTLGVFIAISFIGGVAASYIAGYIGMLMAVNGNMRTANSALTSPKKALEVAFQSGAVAGMVTVGMGLIGATVIMMFATADAMKLLIGFGFGGSLAALFMRVGGGIFTKAADVGADLVGKVEAGIPEDDPRNPATIADNVGDNVGDCAGMAADIFESYEVTLVAAIVLGAATAAIFDQATWMKLILFALMARGVGIVASIVGIYSVRGNDDVESDPLVAIGKGFKVSAVVAAAGTLGLAWWMMGGSGDPVRTTRLLSPDLYEMRLVKQVRAERVRMAEVQEKTVEEITVEDLQKSAALKKLNLDKPEAMGIVSTAVGGTPPEDEDEEKKLEKKLAGYEVIDFSNADNPRVKMVANYAVVDETAMDPANPMAQPKYISLKDKMLKSDYKVFNVAVTQTPLAQQGQPAAKPQTQEFWVGPVEKSAFEKQLAQARAQSSQPGVPKTSFDVKKTLDAKLYANAKGLLAFGVEGEIPTPYRVQGPQISYFQQPPSEIEALVAAGKQPPPPKQTQIGMVEHKTVPWYMFFAPIFFGILMAFAIERLTDYYVSTHKKPVKEVAGVSSAGPAPMIIQGFALGLESSVFSVFAIVAALLAPLYFFPPADYGSYILSFYGIALVGLGLLTTTGYILAMDTFGPISDNAQGVFEMSGAGHDNPQGSKAVQRLDAAGNTTKALTKGFAIATAVVAAVALFHSYIEDANLTAAGLKLDIPEIFLGLLIGGAAPYLFSAFAINAVGRSAFELINEVRRQFKADPGIMAGTSKPNYGSCVAIVTKAAQKELLGPAVLAIALPLAVAFGFSIGKPTTMIGGEAYNLVGAQALGGFLAGAILSGQLMAVLLANSGGIWDNAKKLIEDGLYGGKGSDAHKAGVVVDTVGDPFKDTAGPALNPLIKVMNLVALLLAPVVIQPLNNTVLTVITTACVAALVFSIWWSKRGSMSSAMEEAQASAGSIGTLAPPSAPAPGAAKRKITVEDSDVEQPPSS